jgi:hypothetical protein
MRESSANQFGKTAPGSDLECVAKFQKILPTSHYGSRFCRDQLISTDGNSNEMRILGRYNQKNVGGGGGISFQSATAIVRSTRKDAGAPEISLVRSMPAS